MELIQSLAKTTRDDLSNAGGKGANLGALVQAGFPVPPGFVVLTTAYELFVSMHGLSTEIARLSSEIVTDDLASCEHVSATIRALFKERTMPEDVARAIADAYVQLGTTTLAVRSSATVEDLPGASFAGLHESYLNLHTLTEVYTAIQDCWSSLWTPQALSYRMRMARNTAHNVSMAVVVQQMVQTSAAGVLFTINPVTGAEDEMMINATQTTGEALVSGQVTPEMIIITKTSGQIKQATSEPGMVTPAGNRIATTSVHNDEQQQDNGLTLQETARLIALGKRIEDHFGGAQDIEWAMSNSNHEIFIVQARPVTTHVDSSINPDKHGVIVPPGDDAWDRENDLPARSYDLWTRTNLGENLPYPITPLTESGFTTLFGLDNTAPDPQMPQIVRRFYGRWYTNEGGILHIFSEDMGLPASWLHKMWGSRPRGTQVYPNTFRPLRLLRGLVLSVSKNAKKQKPKKAAQPRHTPAQFQTQIAQWVDEFMQLDIQQFDDQALWDAGLPIWSKRGAYAFNTNMRFSMGAAMSYGLLERIVHWWTHTELTQDLVTGLSGVYSAEVGPALWQMAQTARQGNLQDILQTRSTTSALEMLNTSTAGQELLEQLRLFLVRHGHRCPNELELHNQRWEEAPEQVLTLITQYLHASAENNPEETEERQKQRRLAAINSVETRLDPLRRAIFRMCLKKAQQGVVVRDNSRYAMSRFIFPMRKIYAELGRRWQERGWFQRSDDIFFLTLAEVEQLIATAADGRKRNLQQCVEQRRRAYNFWFKVVPPDAIGWDGRPIVAENDQSNVLKGVAASSGRVQGYARIVQTIQETKNLQPEDILITVATDPGWTPIFPLIKGIVLEIGGQLSHGAIIAREYGIPAVVNLPGAMQLIRDGQLIEIDGSSGEVRICGE